MTECVAAGPVLAAHHLVLRSTRDDGTLLIERFVEVAPIGVHLVDQLVLPCAAPFLHALFMGDGVFDAVEEFVIEKFLQAIAAAKR